MKGVIPELSGSCCGRNSQTPRVVEPAAAAVCEKVSQGFGVAVPAHIEIIEIVK